jgi:hypothetical protein
VSRFESAPDSFSPRDEARRIATNNPKLPELLRERKPSPVRARVSDAFLSFEMARSED